MGEGFSLDTGWLLVRPGGLFMEIYVLEVFEDGYCSLALDFISLRIEVEASLSGAKWWSRSTLQSSVPKGSPLECPGACRRPLRRGWLKPVLVLSTLCCKPEDTSTCSQT